MISECLVNLSDVSIYRPDRSGPGSDDASDTLIIESVKAIHEATNSVIKDGRGQDVTITAKVWIDPPTDDAEATISIYENDWIDWTDYTGARIRKRRIRRASPWYVGATLDHLMLEVE